MLDEKNTNQSKIMSHREMDYFIDHVGRSELFDELKYIKKHGYIKDNDPSSMFGKKSMYLKAVRASLIALGYDSDWIEGEFRTALEKKYKI